MGTFAKVAAGPRSRRTIDLPLPGARVNLETGAWDGDVVKVDVRPLRPDEHVLVLDRARAFAKKHGVEEPDDGHELYERGKIIHTLAIACIDPESSKEDPKPFFDGGAEQILASEILTPEVLAYLYDQQTAYQDECSPLLKSMSPAEFTASVLLMAGQEQPDFFVSMRPGMRWSFTRSMANQLAGSMTRESLSTSLSDEPQTTTEE